MKLRIASVLALSSVAALAQVPNDHCGYSIHIPVLPALVHGTNVGATLAPQFSGCGQIGSDVFYRFTAPYDGTATLSTCPTSSPGTTNFDTVIAVRVGACGFTSAGCNDDNCWLTQSHVIVPITAGVDYDVQIGGFQGAQGTFSLSIVGNPAPPPNDTCYTAIALTVGNTYVGNNFGATTGPDPVPPSPCHQCQKDVWFSFTAPTCGTYDVTTCTGYTTFDTTVGVWQGVCGALSFVACAGDNCALTASTASFYAAANSTWFFSVGGFPGLVAGQYGVVVNAAVNPAMTLAFQSNGPGTLGYAITNAPASGYSFTAFTPNQGAFPYGWFGGIDVSVPEILGQWTTGYPFVAPVNACGAATHGPFGGLPGGFTIYAVSYGFASGSTVPSRATGPVSATVP
jgi:hypothetical protein